MEAQGIERKLVMREFALAIVIVLAFVAVFASLVAREASSTSATYDETSHLPAGFTYLRWDDYRLNPEHPPLIKKLAALFVSRQNPWPPDVEGTGQELAGKPVTDSLTEIKRSWALDSAISIRSGLLGTIFFTDQQRQPFSGWAPGIPCRSPPACRWIKRISLTTRTICYFGGAWQSCCSVYCSRF